MLMNNFSYLAESKRTRNSSCNAKWIRTEECGCSWGRVWFFLHTSYKCKSGYWL